MGRAVRQSQGVLPGMPLSGTAPGLSAPAATGDSAGDCRYTSGTRSASLVALWLRATIGSCADLEQYTFE